MTKSRIILTAADIPADSALTLQEWQQIADAMQELPTESLRALGDGLKILLYLDTQTAKR